MRLSLAYADYSFFGENPNELHAIIGKMKTPFLTTPDDLVLDADTNPEGLAAKGQYTVGMATLYANGGYFWAEERADTSDLMLYAGQAAAKLQFVPEAAVTLGATCYGFQNMAGYDVVDWVIGRPLGEDQKVLMEALDRAGDAAEVLISQGSDRAMNRFN